MKRIMLVAIVLTMFTVLAMDNVLCSEIISINYQVFPELSGNEESLFFPNKSVVDQIPEDCETDIESQMIFNIGTALYNSGQFEDAASKFNLFFWDAGERKQKLSQRTIDYVLMWRAYSLSELDRQEEAQAIHEFRLSMMEEHDKWVVQLPTGITVNEFFVGEEKKYVIGVINEELSITHMTIGETADAEKNVIASLEAFLELGAYGKAVSVGLVFMQNCSAFEEWYSVLSVWDLTWSSMKALMETPNGINLNVYPQGFVQMHRYLLQALVNLNQVEDALKVSDRIVGFQNDTGYSDGYSEMDISINNMLHENIGN